MPLILPGNVGSATAATGYDVANSCRFDDSGPDYLSGPNTTAGSTKTKFTFSVWVKRSELSGTGGDELLIGKWTSGNDRGHINFSDDQIRLFEKTSSSVTAELLTNRLFRDVSAWYHILYIGDTTQAVAANRLKLFVNGTQESSFATATYPAEDSNWQLQALAKNYGIGALAADNAGGVPSSFYLSEVVYLDGITASVTDFGEFDSDSPTIWKPKDVSGLTFGSNGFYLDFEDSGDLGDDESGNGNDFTENNIAAVNQSTDTCTNNFATLNPLASVTDIPTFSDGNLTIDIANAGAFGAQSTIGVASGKWYAEFKLVASSDNDMAVGVNSDGDSPRSDLGAGFGTHSTGYRETGTLAVNGTDDISYGDSYTVNDIVGVALDLDNNKLYFSKNGTFQASGDPTSGATGTGAKALTAAASTQSGFYFFNPSCHSGSQNGDWSANFGSPPYAISSGNTDGNGYGNFEYAVPSGYLSLCTKNLGSDGG